MKLMSGSSNIPLAQAVATFLGQELYPLSIHSFPDGERQITLDAAHPLELLAGQDVVIIQSTSPPIDSHIMELLLLLKTIRSYAPRSLRVVIPYYGYGRQEPAISHFIADLFVKAGATQLFIVEPHTPFHSPLCQTLSPLELMAQDIQKRWGKDYVIVAPDKGGLQRAQNLASFLNVELITLTKRRTPEPIVEIVSGTLLTKRAIILDDLVDSGRTLAAVAHTLHGAGATEVHGYVTHGLFRNQEPAFALFDSPLLSLTVTDSILLPALENIRLLPLGALLGNTLLSWNQSQT